MKDESLSQEALSHLSGLLNALNISPNDLNGDWQAAHSASEEGKKRIRELEMRNRHLETVMREMQITIEEERRKSSLLASTIESMGKHDLTQVQEDGSFCVMPAEKGSVSVMMDDDGSRGIGVTAAAAMSIASARAWAGFARDTAASKSRRFQTLPARSSYRLITQVMPGSSLLFPGEQNFRAVPVNPLDLKKNDHAEANPDIEIPPNDDVDAPVMPRPRGTTLSLEWLEEAKTVLVVSKPTPEVMEQTFEIVRWLRKRGLCVFVEPRVYNAILKRQAEAPENGEVRDEDGRVLRYPEEVQELYSHLVAQHQALGSPRVSGGLPSVRSLGRSNLGLGHSEDEHEDSHRAPSESVSEDAFDSCACGHKTGNLLTWREDGGLKTLHEVTDHLDLIVALGGDGTVLWTCSLFDNRPVPPVVAFGMGSLGFMAPFEVREYESVLDRVLHGHFPLSIRHRLHCRVHRKNQDEGSGGGTTIEDHVVLNEVAFDRGSSPFLTKLEVYADNSFVTTVQGDGLIIATPSGSTAYSLAAGGNMVHPSVPAVLLTPICAHSLSFRPVVFPEHVRLAVQVPKDSRSSTWCSFDGKKRTQLQEGDAVFVRVSRFPVPLVCAIDSTVDWFYSLSSNLGWNQRIVQGGPVGGNRPGRDGQA